MKNCTDFPSCNRSDQTPLRYVKTPQEAANALRDKHEHKDICRTLLDDGNQELHCPILISILSGLHRMLTDKLSLFKPYPTLSKAQPPPQTGCRWGISRLSHSASIRKNNSHTATHSIDEHNYKLPSPNPWPTPPSQHKRRRRHVLDRDSLETPTRNQTRTQAEDGVSLSQSQQIRHHFPWHTRIG